MPDGEQEWTRRDCEHLSGYVDPEEDVGIALCRKKVDLKNGCPKNCVCYKSKNDEQERFVSSDNNQGGLGLLNDKAEKKIKIGVERSNTESPFCVTLNPYRTTTHYIDIEEANDLYIELGMAIRFAKRLNEDQGSKKKESKQERSCVDIAKGMECPFFAQNAQCNLDPTSPCVAENYRWNRNGRLVKKQPKEKVL